MSDDDGELCHSVASMLEAGLPFLKLQWLQLCPYKVPVNVPVRFLIQLLSCFNSKISVSLVVGIVLPYTWLRIGVDAVLVVLPR